MSSIEANRAEKLLALLLDVLVIIEINTLTKRSSIGRDEDIVSQKDRLSPIRTNTMIKVKLSQRIRCGGYKRVIISMVGSALGSRIPRCQKKSITQIGVPRSMH